jgi:succinyl-diaminopimelate desuccinylase
MKGGLSAALFTFLLLAEESRHLPGTVSLCVVSDGESGGQWGTKWMLGNTALRTANAVIMAEPGGPDVVAIGEKGSFWLKLRLRGKSAHAAYDTLGESAILKMICAIPAVTALRQIHQDPPEDLAEIIRLERPFIENAYGPGIGEVLTRVSATVSRIKGGSAINLVPEECEIDFDLRLPIGILSTLVEAKLTEELARTGVTEYEMKTLACSEATYTQPKERIVRAVSRNVERITSQPVRQFIKIGATDTRFMRHGGIPAVCYGPGFHNMGGPDEFVTIEELLTVAKVHGCSIIDFILEE